MLRLFGENMELLRKKGEEIARVLSKIEGATDLLTEKVTGQLYLTIDIDRPKIARYGLNVSDIQNLVEIAIAGKPASRFYEENRSFAIAVRLPEENRNLQEERKRCKEEILANPVVIREGDLNWMTELYNALIDGGIPCAISLSRMSA